MLQAMGVLYRIISLHSEYVFTNWVEWCFGIFGLEFNISPYDDCTESQVTYQNQQLTERTPPPNK